MEHTPLKNPIDDWAEEETRAQRAHRRRNRAGLIALLVVLLAAALLVAFALWEPAVSSDPAEPTAQAVQSSAAAVPATATPCTPSAAPTADPTAPPIIGAGLEVTFLDVGQGDCIFLRAPSGRTMLVDAGVSAAFDKVDAFLTKENVVGLDVVVASHLHADHIGGLIGVVDTYPIGAFYRPPFDAESETFFSLLGALEESNVRVETPLAGADTTIPWSEEVEVRILSPYEVLYDDFNDTSYILSVRYGNTAVLLTGDAGEIAEKLALKAQPNHLFHANILKVGHHGSRYGTLNQFLDTVGPSFAVICCGENDYGLPSKSLIERLEERDITVCRTDEDGTITFLLDGTNVTMVK